MLYCVLMFIDSMCTDIFIYFYTYASFSVYLVVYFYLNFFLFLFLFLFFQGLLDLALFSDLFSIFLTNVYFIFCYKSTSVLLRKSDLAVLIDGGSNKQSCVCGRGPLDVGKKVLAGTIVGK